LAVGEVIQGEDEGGVRFLGGGEAVGAVPEDGIDYGICGEGFDAGEDDVALGEGDIDGANGLEMGWFIPAKSVAGTGGEVPEC